MELIPRQLVIGLFAAANPTATDVATPDKLNRLWSEVAPEQGYRQYLLSPDGTGAQFTGATADDGLTIQLPLVQVRRGIGMMGAAQAADDAQMVLKAVARNLGLEQFFNLGIRHVYHASAPDNDGRGFVLHRLINKTEDDFGELRGGGDLWAGVKYVVTTSSSVSTLMIEPLQADNRSLFIDLDVQHPGPVSLDTIKEKAQESERFLSQTVNAYLDRRASEM
jgi:hypothetical protein